MNRILVFAFSLFAYLAGICQSVDTLIYRVTVESSAKIDKYFTRDSIWRGADGASSIDLENGKILWLFSDSFIDPNACGARKNSIMVRNSIALQDGNNLNTAIPRYYWGQSGGKPDSFFKIPGKFWFWTGHGTRIKDKLIVFLMEIKAVKTGLGFEAYGWYVVVISNPDDPPSQWKMSYKKGPETYGTIAGSAAVLKDEKYLYAYGAVEPSTHEVYLLRWKLKDAYSENFSKPEWWIKDDWAERKSKMPVPEPLFIGGTEYSVHYDKTLKKFIQIQSFGFGEGQIGLRMSDSLQGKWTEPYLFYTPSYRGVKRPFMYSAKVHPELSGDGIYITYNVNSFDFGELIENQTIYYPKFIHVKIERKVPH